MAPSPPSAQTYSQPFIAIPEHKAAVDTPVVDIPQPPTELDRKDSKPTDRKKSNAATMATDCRTSSYVSWKKSARTGSTATTDSGHVGTAPARIFEHRRGPQKHAKDEPQGRKTEVRLPLSFKEIESWLEAIVQEAVEQRPDAEDDGTSAVKILFLNEKRCKRRWKDELFDVTRLHPILKINDWTTAHYMVTYCRFPMPLDTDDDHGSTVESMGHDWDWRFTISHPFDWDMLWAYFPQTRTSVGIMRTWFDGYDTDFMDMESIVETFGGPTLGHPMLLGMFALQILTTDAMANVREKGNRLYEAQRWTGFHVYNRLRTTDAAAPGDDSDGPDLSAVTREVLGAASNLTGWDNATPQLVGFARFVIMENVRFRDSKWAPSTRSFERLCDYIDQQAEKQITDLDGAKRDCMAWLATATFLLQGVLNLVSQRDATVNIDLARSSNKIAMESKRDATSMMSIAVLTMFFLPGTFTSSFFALPFFSAELSSPSSFWIYWAVTAPLTIIVLGIWLVYLWLIKRPKPKSPNLPESEKN